MFQKIYVIGKPIRKGLTGFAEIFVLYYHIISYEDALELAKNSGIKKLYKRGVIKIFARSSCLTLPKKIRRLPSAFCEHFLVLVIGRH